MRLTTEEGLTGIGEPAAVARKRTSLPVPRHWIGLNVLIIMFEKAYSQHVLEKLSINILAIYISYSMNALR